MSGPSCKDDGDEDGDDDGDDDDDDGDDDDDDDDGDDDGYDNDGCDDDDDEDELTAAIPAQASIKSFKLPQDPSSSSKMPIGKEERQQFINRFKAKLRKLEAAKKKQMEEKAKGRQQSSAVKKSALKTSRGRSIGNGRSVSFSITLSIVRFKIEVGSTLRRRRRSWTGSHIFPWSEEVERVNFGRGGQTWRDGIIELTRAPELLRPGEVYLKIAMLREQWAIEKIKRLMRIVEAMRELEAALAEAADAAFWEEMLQKPRLFDN